MKKIFQGVNDYNNLFHKGIVKEGIEIIILGENLKEHYEIVEKGMLIGIGSEKGAGMTGEYYPSQIFQEKGIEKKWTFRTPTELEKRKRRQK